MPDQPRITPWVFDSMFPERDQKLWGLPLIAQALGVSVDTARRWARDPSRNLPVSKPGGRYFAMRSELLAWLRVKR